MPNHIFINRESGNDNISIFYDEPSFVVIANKDDLTSIQLIDESKKPGIYILLGADKRYIGQASNAIFNRLQQHYINPKLQEQISHTINPIKSVFSLIFIFYGLNLTGGSSGEKLFGCLIASLPAR